MVSIAWVSEKNIAVRKGLLYNSFVISSSDINECLLDIHECDVNATCNNTIGDYDCQCNTGFEGDGFTCASEFKKVFTLQAHTTCLRIQPVVQHYHYC